MLGYQYLLLLVLAISLANMPTAFAQQSPEDCGPNQVFQLGFCQDIVTQVVVAWDKPTYKICDTGVVTIQAQEENTDPNLIQIFFAKVTSDSDPLGVEILMIEIGNDSGIFVGELQLCGDLSVSEGDYVYAEYGNIGDAARIESSTSIPPITVSTDRYSYKVGDTIRISGNVSELLSGYAVSLQVVAPDGNRIIVEQLDVSYSGSFNTVLTAGGSLWEDSGTYTIKVLYGTASRTAEATFWFEASSIAPPSPISTNFVSIPAGTSVPGCEETDECWDPPVIIVDVGATVTWSNDDTAAHTVTSGNAADGPSGIFDSGMFMARDVFSHTFTRAGEFEYFCVSSMAGRNCDS